MNLNLGNLFFTISANVQEALTPLEQARAKAQELLDEFNNKKIQIPGLSSFANELKKNLQSAQVQTNNFLKKVRAGFGTFGSYLKRVGITAGKNFAMALNTNLKIAVTHVRAQLQNLKMQFQRFSSIFAGFGFIGGGLLFADMIKSTIQFEQELAQVSTMLDKSAMTYMRQYGEELNKLAGQFGQTTSALSKGLYDILSATIEPAKAMDVLKASLIGASAGLTSVDKALNVTITILKSYGLEASKAGEVQDWLFNVVKKGRVTYDELAGSLGRVLSIAKTVGASLDEVGAMITTMTKAGLNINETVTSISAIFNAILSPSEEAKKVMKELGLEMDVFAIKSQGFIGVLKQLKGLPPDIIATLLPNRRALRGILPLLNNMNGYLEDYQFIMTNLGSAYEAFEKNTSTTQYKLKRLKETLYATGRQLLDRFLPAIQNITNAFIAFLNVVQRIPIEFSASIAVFFSLSKALKNLGLVHLLPNWKEFINIIKYGGMALGSFIGVVQRVATAIFTMNLATLKSVLSISGVKRALIALGVAIRAFNPWLLVITTALTVIILRFDDVKKAFIKFKIFIFGLGKAFIKAGKELANAVKSLFTLDVAQASQSFSKIGEIFREEMTNIGKDINEAMEKEQAKAELKALQSADDVVAKMKGVLYKVSKLYTDTFIDGMKNLKDNPVIERIKEEFKNMIINIKLGFITDKSEALDKLNQIEEMLGKYKIDIKQAVELKLIGGEELEQRKAQIEELEKEITKLRKIIKMAKVGKGEIFETDDKQLLTIKRVGETIKIVVNQLGQMDAKAEEAGKNLKKTFVEAFERLGMSSEKAKNYVNELFTAIVEKGLSGKEILAKVSDELISMGYDVQQVQELLGRMSIGFQGAFKQKFEETFKSLQEQFQNGTINIVEYKERLEELANTAKQYGVSLSTFYMNVEKELEDVNKDIAKERTKVIEEIDKFLNEASGKSAEKQLAQIEKTVEYWKKLGVDEVKIKQWAEAQKLKITKDRIEQEIQAEEDRVNRVVSSLKREIEFRRQMAKLKGEYTPEVEANLQTEYKAKIEALIKQEEEKAKKVLQIENLTAEERTKAYQKYTDKVASLRFELLQKEREWGNISVKEFADAINTQILQNEKLNISEETRGKILDAVNSVLKQYNDENQKASQNQKDLKNQTDKTTDSLKNQAKALEEVAQRLGTLESPKVEGLDKVFKVGDIVRDSFGNLIKVLEVDEKGAISKFVNIGEEGAKNVGKAVGSIVKSSVESFASIAKKGFDAVANAQGEIVSNLSNWTENFTKSLSLSLNALKQFYEAKMRLRIMDMIQEAKLQELREKAEEKARRAQMAFMERYAGHNRMADLIMGKGLELAFQKISTKWQSYISVLKQGLGSGNINIPALRNPGTNINQNFNFNINVSEGVTNKDVIKKVVREGLDELGTEFERLSFGSVSL